MNNTFESNDDDIKDIEPTNLYNFNICKSSFSEHKFDYDAFLKLYPNYYENVNKFDKIENMNDINELHKLVDYFVKMRHDYMIKANLRFMMDLGIYRHKNIYDEMIDTINNVINKKFYSHLNKPVIFDPNEIINGYPVKKYVDRKITISNAEYAKILKIWDGNNVYVNDDNDHNQSEMNYKEFVEKYNENACSEWSKQDRFGESYSGYWKYPTDSEEYKNAWNLTYEDNHKALFELPYPKMFILETILIGCVMRLECVAFSNYLCEWVKRKREITSE